MKKLLIFTVLFARNEMANAQNVFTNWLMTAPNIREVGGKFYNTDHSLLFTNFSGNCVSVFQDGIIIHEQVIEPIIRNESYGSASYGNLLGGGVRQVKIGERVVSERNLFILHFPTNTEATSGSKQQGRAMHVGTTNINGDTMELLDFGRRHLYSVMITNSANIGKISGNTSGNRISASQNPSK